MTKKEILEKCSSNSICKTGDLVLDEQEIYEAMEEYAKHEVDKVLDYDAKFHVRFQYLKDSIRQIASQCDNQNPTHEAIWRIANDALEELTLDQLSDIAANMLNESRYDLKKIDNARHFYSPSEKDKYTCRICGSGMEDDNHMTIYFY